MARNNKEGYSGRISGKRKENNKVLILTNGIDSEKNYFGILKAQTRSPYSIKIEFQNGDPSQVFEKAVQLRQKFNHIWCVFNLDDFYDQGKIEPVFTKVRQYQNISIACSNEAFEVWLINHYINFESNQGRSSYTSIIEDIIFNESGQRITYDKADDKFLEKWFVPRHKIATQNSKLTWQNKIVLFEKDNPRFSAQPQIWDLSNVTTVYKVIEFLRLESKNRRKSDSHR